jgi:peroxiredoxin
MTHLLRKGTFWIVMVAVVFTVLGVFISFQKNRPDPLAKPLLPMIKVFDLNEKQRELDEWRGNWMLLNYWATWCSPCVEEIPRLIEFQNQLNGQKFQLLGLAIDDLSEVRHFLDRFAVNYPILITGEEGIQVSYSQGNMTGVLPYTVLINPEGRVVYTHAGAMAQADLDEVVRMVSSQNP